MHDFIDDISPNQFVATDGSKPSIAGNYGMHTNVYQIGLIVRITPHPSPSPYLLPLC